MIKKYLNWVNILNILPNEIMLRNGLKVYKVMNI